ncbi:MAG: hypothetical protein BMS9Abin31_0686 [Gammaproteobacteria bacterium]|nr:MAG: hypothetical protein BMS9Abin31_0686 [Gammaproteobacteria bacterium]
MGINRLAGIWGVAEATVFFIVPDVWLSIVGRNKLRVGLIACFYSLAGALIGGVFMYYWGSTDQHSANQFLDKIPAINSELIKDVNHQLIEQGLVAVLFGPLSGTPYKIYAVQVAGQGLSIWIFMLISIIARLMRFTLVTSLCHYALKIVNRVIDKKYNLKILLAGWFAFYLFYFTVMGI